jgi:4-hydroxy-tetrahydrodipicolinate synthase
MSFSPKGIIPAVWTPTDATGNLLKGALRKNIEAMLAAGVDALLVLGSTGEFIHLSVAQRQEVLECALEVAGKTPTLTNISHTNPRTVVELGKHAKEAGAAAVSLLAPWFYPLSEDDLVAFFVEAGKGIELPIILYNFLAMTGKNLTPEVVRRIASEIPIAGIKHSAGDFEEHKAFADIGREFGFNVVTGWDTHIPEAFALGAKGAVAGMANFVPELLAQIYRLVNAGRLEEVREPVRQMRRLGDLLGALEFPLNIAAAMEARGREVGAPKSVVSPQTRFRYNALRASIRAALDEFEIA